MKVVNLSEQNSVFGQFLSELRDVNIQKDSMRFRRNIERIGEIFAYEISKTLNYSSKEVQTPLGIATCSTYDDTVVIASILRAGLPLHQGILNYFDRAQNAYIASYRKYGKDNRFEIQVQYVGAPSILGKTLILADPMLATGSSMALAYDRLCKNGMPEATHIVSIVSSAEGVNYLMKRLPSSATLWLGSIDEELTNKSYIVPGLGDAGDLAFGSKL